MEGTPTEYMRIVWMDMNEGEAWAFVPFWRTMEGTPTEYMRIVWAAVNAGRPSIFLWGDNTLLWTKTVWIDYCAVQRFLIPFTVHASNGRSQAK